MAFVSLKDFLARTGLASPPQVDEWTKAWRVAVESGSQENLLGFICRERGVPLHTDAVQAAAYLPVDVQELNVDLHRRKLSHLLV